MGPEHEATLGANKIANIDTFLQECGPKRTFVLYNLGVMLSTMILRSLESISTHALSDLRNVATPIMILEQRINSPPRGVSS